MGSPRLTLAVVRGLARLASLADAGGPDDLNIDTTTRDGRRQWADVQRAIKWATWKLADLESTQAKRKELGQ